MTLESINKCQAGLPGKLFLTDPHDYRYSILLGSLSIN